MAAVYMTDDVNFKMLIGMSPDPQSKTSIRAESPGVSNQLLNKAQ